MNFLDVEFTSNFGESNHSMLKTPNDLDDFFQSLLEEKTQEIVWEENNSPPTSIVDSSDIVASQTIIKPDIIERSMRHLSSSSLLSTLFYGYVLTAQV